jgi:hypothetical protein
MGVVPCSFIFSVSPGTQYLITHTIPQGAHSQSELQATPATSELMRMIEAGRMIQQAIDFLANLNGVNQLSLNDSIFT